MNISHLTLIRNAFVYELQQASVGKAPSIAFIKHHLATQPLVNTDEIFQVLVIGGTNLKKASVRKSGTSVEVLTQVDLPVVPFHTKTDFMQFMEEQIDPRVSVVALNFAFALEPVFINGKLDGKLVVGAKEHAFEGLIGSTVGESIEEHILKARNQKITVTLANDTICLLLAGLNLYSWEEAACGIVGTGLNFAMFLDHTTAINLESGEFTGFELSEEAKEIDKDSRNPKKALLEKEVAGAYLYRHYNYRVRKENIATDSITSTQELNSILADSTHPGYTVATAVMEHSAALVAMQASALMEFKKTSLGFNMSGSLFWKGNGYKEAVERITRELSPEYTASFIHIHNAEIAGAAHLVSGI